MVVRATISGVDEAAAWLGDVKGRMASRDEILSRLAQRFLDEVVPANYDRGLEPRSEITKKIHGPGPVLGSIPSRASVLVLDGSELVIGVEGGIPGLLEHGGRTSSASAVPGREIPARPIFYLPDADLDEAVEDTADAVFLGTGVLV